MNNISEKELLRRQKISETMKKKFAETEHWLKGKIGKNKDKKFSLEWRKNLSEAHKGFTVTEETKIKISIASKGRKATTETRKKISESKKGKLNPMYGHIGVLSPRFGKENKWGAHTPEQIQKMKDRWHDTHNNKRGEQSPAWKGGGVKVYCNSCGKEKIIKRSRLKEYKHFFCNKECMNNWLSVNYRGENNREWRGGISKLPYSFDFNKELKELIRKRDSYKCQLCSIEETLLDVNLSVHHIDYDKQNSDPRNLIALCVGCNVKVNTNREYWTNYFISVMEAVK